MTETHEPYRTPLDKLLERNVIATNSLPVYGCIDCLRLIDGIPPALYLCQPCLERADEAQRDHRVREAAHDMLAALEGLRPFGMPCFCSERSGLHSRECQRALDAIAKARGGAE